jgi:predicted transcriptional regulator
MKKLPEAELKVMLILWQAEEALTSNEILARIDDKDWHVATLNKMLTRLIEKKFVRLEKKTRPKTYWYLVDKNVYKSFESKDLFKTLHKNSLKSLVASLFNDELTKDDIDEIEKLIEKKRGSNE